MERKIDEYRTGFHRFHVACPRTVRVGVADELVIHTENPTDGRREFKILKVQIDPKTQFGIARHLFYPEFLLLVVIDGSFVTAKIHCLRNPCEQIRPDISGAQRREFEQ